MIDISPARSVVVGIDGSKAAIDAAVWAIDEAVSRDIPLRLVYVVDPVELTVGRSNRGHFACARAALYDAQRSVELTGRPVKIETEILCGKPLATLAQASRSAAMVCVGSIGTKHALHGAGSVATALPGLAHCPVAVIRPAQGRTSNARRGSVLVEMDNGVALRHAFDEARLRGTTLRAVASWRAEAPDDIGDADRLAQAHLNRRLARWTRLYPDVAVESVVFRGSLCDYLTRHARSVDIFVTGTGGCQGDSGSLAACSMLTVRENHL